MLGVTLKLESAFGKLGLRWKRSRSGVNRLHERVAETSSDRIKHVYFWKIWFPCLRCESWFVTGFVTWGSPRRVRGADAHIPGIQMDTAPTAQNS